MHIGLIGGIGLAATEYYYRGLVERHARSNTALELTIVHADVRELAKNLATGAAQRQAEVFLHLVRRLAAAGAELAAITSMGGHFCVEELKRISPLPILDAIPEVDAEIRRRNLKRVGILGTRTVMETALYGGISSAQVVRPDALNEAHNNYIEMAIAGRTTEAQRQVFFSIGRRLCQTQGAEAVILGGTDLVLAFAGQDCGFRVIDCAEVHIDALYRKSTSQYFQSSAASPQL
jgi:aspartate racemase